ncbi:SLC13 family permease [bacterium]|nr:SLC13 family permease [bacterium]
MSLNQANLQNRLISSIVLASGPVIFLVLLTLLNPVDMPPTAAKTAAIAAWMGIWWLTEAVPLAVTSLLPIIMFPLTGVLEASTVAQQFTNDVVFLFIGGFLVALAMERWNLHRRIALHILKMLRGGLTMTLLGFMVSTAFLSMWISNTATAMMMVPIAMAVLVKFEELLDTEHSRKFTVALLLGIAYSASIGGFGTLVGTPPNLVFAQVYHITFSSAPEISFANWILFAGPLAVLFLLLAWGVLSWLLVPRTKLSIESNFIQNELRDMGKMKSEEKYITIIFVSLAVLWITRNPIDLGSISFSGWSILFPEPDFIGDGTVAITLSLLLFIIPSKAKGKVLDIGILQKLPWGIVLLFGGGFALAKAFMLSGLSAWIGNQLAGLSTFSDVSLIASVCTMMTFLTELTSNTATTQMALPLLAALAESIGRDPLLLMIPATLSASCAFMMPVATPPNAIIFGTGKIRVIEMARVGVILNFCGIMLLTFWMIVVAPLFLSSW